MELLSNLSLGLEVAMTWANLLYCLGGVALGTNRVLFLLGSVLIALFLR